MPNSLDPMECSMPCFLVFHYLLEFVQAHVHWVDDTNHLILCHPLLLLLSISPSIRVFPNDSVLPIRWPKYWCFNISISPANKYKRLISFRIDWLELLTAQGTLKSFIQHHSSKASILRCSPFFRVQLLHPSMTTGKTVGLNIWTFAIKVMSLIFNRDVD